MQKVHILILVMAVLLAWSHVEAASGPYQVRHQAPAFVERGVPVELTFSAAGIDPKDVQEAYVFYRQDGDMGYSQEAAKLHSSNFKVSLSITDKQATKLEYYFVIRLNDGRTVTYPRENATADPIRVEVVDPKKSERQQRVDATGVDYTILSPDPGNTVSQQDVVVAITLFYDPVNIDTARTSFRMYGVGKK
ncbi:MAG: hypothetical protein U5J63_17640 [Fodinibius sp.]|nr:hypothetical protein [Fodinibius sp.]